ncbi:MAG: serine/threonine-protein kinase [Synechococcales bacterium]|nr:serine/threonine-protein kinase [Synechococcales bacterium]
MQPSLSPGTLLQNRYYLVRVLGQGGFGRTYLAQDQGRFNELCALKEFIPMQGAVQLFEKSKELFQREAATLYQLQHPQIPQFRATFEQDHRFFLVQDFVDGKTYRSLLDERRMRGVAFAETEVLQLLHYLLPVLAHIHSKGIVHRDISPDNIILRDRDRLPVLIDFGVVKEIATRLQQTDIRQTTVGKLGYAPPEQMQTGQVSPCSDIYALGVTSVVLLTGQDPQKLFDDVNLVWLWQRWLPQVNTGLADVLDRMLMYRPGDRFQTALDVSHALLVLSGKPPGSGSTNFPLSQSSPPSTAGLAESSKLQTIAVSRTKGTPYAPTQTPSYATNSPPHSAQGSFWDDPWAVALGSLVMAILAGLGSWALVTVIRYGGLPQPPTSLIPTQPPTPTPIIILTPSPTPSPTLTPVNYSQRLELLEEKPVSIDKSLQANETLTYIISGQQGQQLNAYLSGEGVLLSILGPDQSPVDQRSERVSAWQGTLPFTGDYFIKLNTVRGLPRGDYQLNLSLLGAKESSPTPSPTISPTPLPSPTYVEESVSFPSGTVQAVLSGRTGPIRIKRYLVTLTASQELKVTPNGAVRVDIQYPDGTPVAGASQVSQWSGKVSRDGIYQINILSAQETDFQLEISVR